MLSDRLPALAGSFIFDAMFDKETVLVKKIVVLCIIVIALLAGCTDRGGQSDTVAYDFSLKDMSGKTVRLSDYKGRVVLLEFWATWCPPCRASVPGLEKLHRAYKDKGLVLLAVAMDMGGDDEVRSYVKESGITYTVLKGTEDVATKYQVRSIPMMLVLNKEGKITKRYLGMGSDDDLEADIKASL
jgi:thiol-disulfide isomerase/thioredoxin